MREVAFFLILLLFPSVSSWAAEAISVVTTTTDLAAIAQAVGGDRVKVESIAKGFQDPHYVEAKPSYMRLLNRARLLFSVGLQLEVGWLPLLIQGARNPSLVHVDLFQGISVLERPTGPISRAQGDIHPEGNPHYWLDPRNGTPMARRIAQELKTLSPGDAVYFDDRLSSFERELKSRIKLWEERMAPYRGLEVVAYHKQWEYLARWLGLSIIDYVEDKPGIPPGPRHLTSLIQTMRQRKVKLLLVANFNNSGLAQSVADKSGAQMIVLPASVGGEERISGFTDLFDSITAHLLRALK